MRTDRTFVLAETKYDATLKADCPGDHVNDQQVHEGSHLHRS
jgi:hypothetical protein